MEGYIRILWKVSGKSSNIKRSMTLKDSCSWLYHNFRLNFFPFILMKKINSLQVLVIITFGLLHQIVCHLFARNWKSLVSFVWNEREVDWISALCNPDSCNSSKFQCLGSLSGSTKRNAMLKSLRKFGPFFRISFDLTLSSFRPGQDGLSNILSFIPSGQTPVLQINVNNVGRLDFGVGKSSYNPD